MHRWNTDTNPQPALPGVFVRVFGTFEEQTGNNEPISGRRS